MHIGEVIKRSRKRIIPKITQAEFAKKVGITTWYLSRIESGHVDPSKYVLDKIAEALDVPLALLVWYTADEKNIPKEKIEAFRLMKPSVDALINEFINV